MWQLDYALAYELDDDFATVMEFIKELSDNRSFTIVDDDPDRAEELKHFSGSTSAQHFWESRSSGGR